MIHSLKLLGPLKGVLLGDLRSICAERTEFGMVPLVKYMKLTQGSMDTPGVMFRNLGIIFVALAVVSLLLIPSIPVVILTVLCVTSIDLGVLGKSAVTEAFYLG